MGILSKLKFFSKPQEVKSLSIPSRPAKVRNFVSETKGVSEKMKGSPFPSPEADKLMNQTAFLPTDWQQRLQDYILVETFFDNDVVAAEAVEMLCRGAVGNKGYTFMAKPIDDSPEAKFYAEETNRICGDIQRRQLDAEKVGDCAVELGKLSNLPIQLVWKGKEIDEIIPMAPYGFRINTDERNQFYDKKACYIQYDTAIPSAQKPLASFSQKEMVFATYKKRPWERYGRLVALKVAKECESIIKGIEYISDGRASAMPETNYIASWGDAKNMLTDEQMKEFQSTLNKPIVDTEKGNPYRRRVLNGQVDVKYVTTGTDYFSNVTDLDFHASRISAAWRVAYALIIFSNRISQQALLQLTENLYEAQSVFAAILDRQIIMPIFKLALEEQGVDVSKISIEFIWHQRKLPSRLTAEAEAAAKYVKTQLPDGTYAIDIDSARAIICNSLGLDPSLVKTKCEQEKEETVPMSQEEPEDKGQTLQGNVLAHPSVKMRYESAQKAGQQHFNDNRNDIKRKADMKK